MSTTVPMTNSMETVNGRLIYIARDGTVYVSSGLHSLRGVESIAGQRAISMMSSGHICSGDEFVSFVSDFDDDPGSGISRIYDNGELECFLFSDKVRDAEYYAPYLYVRNDSHTDFSALSIDGGTFFIRPSELTVIENGRIMTTYAAGKDLVIVDRVRSRLDEIAGQDSDIMTKIETAYREGYYEAKVSSEVERFGRIWTDECQAVNGNNISPMLNLFLTTVEPESRELVHRAILDKYRKP